MLSKPMIILMLITSLIGMGLVLIFSPLSDTPASTPNAAEAYVAHAAASSIQIEKIKERISAILAEIDNLNAESELAMMKVATSNKFIGGYESWIATAAREEAYEAGGRIFERKHMKKNIEDMKEEIEACEDQISSNNKKVRELEKTAENLTDENLKILKDLLETFPQTFYEAFFKKK